MDSSGDFHELKRVHYELEKLLAQRIRESSKSERRDVVREAYAELFEKITWHPQLAETEEKREERQAWKLEILGRWIRDGGEILELGCGDGLFIHALAPRCKRAVGIDISKAVLPKESKYINTEFYQMDALSLQFEDESFDLVLSSHLLEHLHPDEVDDHFQEIKRVLRRGGHVLIETPNRLTGPHDISKYFDDIATGFHLKEWTYRELAGKLKQHGFDKMKTQLLPWRMVKGRRWVYELAKCPVGCKFPLEAFCSEIKSRKIRNIVGRRIAINGIVVYARKPL